MKRRTSEGDALVLQNLKQDSPTRTPPGPQTANGIRDLLSCAPGILIFAGQRLVSHRGPHPAFLTAQSTHPLREFGVSLSSVNPTSITCID